MLYAIVDIETTGSHASSNGITEIGIVIHDGTQVLHMYETLVNPHIPIPYFIQRLTGITDDMVANAPSFEEVAGHIHELLQDKVFVAHNVNFDYSFLNHQLQQCGYELGSRKLCTVRLSRKIIPGLYGYSLGKLCHQLNINITNRHRAGGDALATAILFGMLVARDEENAIGAMLKGKNKEQYLPPHLPVAQIENLPGGPGVYYFYNAAGKTIYVGKAKNIRKRVRSHFSNNKINKQKQDFLRDIYKVSYKPCATELMAHILESTEIRRLWPIYNRSQRGYLPRFGLFSYEDRQGIIRLGIEKHKQHYKPIFTFNTITEGHYWMRKLISEFELCARLCNLSKDTACTHESCSCGEQATAIIPTAYNHQVLAAIEWMQKHLPTFVLLDKGNDDEEQSCILMKKGNFYGMGYIRNKELLNDVDMLATHLEPMPDNDYIRNLVYKHANTFPDKCVSFS